MKIIRLTLVCSLINLMAGQAQVPGTLSYQGILMQNDGITPIADGAHSIVFNFYTASTGGSALFSRTISVTTTKGLYTCIIGGGTAPNAPFNATEKNQLGSQQIFIGIALDGGSELLPRAQLTTSPYSLRSESITNTANPAGGNVSFWGANNTLSSDAGLFWDNTNKRLGIGTSTPTDDLEIAGSGYPYITLNKLSNSQESGIVFKTGGVAKGYLYTKNDATSALTFFSEETGGDGSVPRLRMPFNNKNIYLAESGGYVGIGTGAPAGPLDIKGSLGNLVAFDYTLQFTRPSTNYIHATSPGGHFYFTVNGNADTNPALMIKANGNVGIGTTNPAERLHVVGNIFATGTITPSDSRLKENISDLNYGLNEVLKLRPVSYTWKSEPNGEKQLGLIAQETLVIVPEIIRQPRNENEFYALNYVQLIPVLIKATQEQQTQIEGLKTTNKNLEERLLSIEALLRKYTISSSLQAIQTVKP